MGSVSENISEGTVTVQDDFDLVCFDLVSNPSTHGAFVSPKGRAFGVSEDPNVFQFKEEEKSSSSSVRAAKIKEPIDYRPKFYF